MAGNTSLGENYAFAGMHHIFDQHTTTGAIRRIKMHVSETSHKLDY